MTCRPMRPSSLGKGQLDADTLGRIAGDYRRTLAKLHLDYVNHWVNWSHARGFIARNQAHGAPGNLLDLYAAADIPETESFGMTELPIAGLRVETAHARPDPDPPLGTGRAVRVIGGARRGPPLVSSETLTWLRENFRETPGRRQAAARPAVRRRHQSHFLSRRDLLAADVPWPGWFFYAATQLGPDNPLWQHFTAMNTYVTRVQSILQAGRPDNDVLLYWPFDELADRRLAG